MSEGEARQIMYEARPKGRVKSTAPEPTVNVSNEASTFKKIAVTVIGGVLAAYAVKHLKLNKLL